MAKVVGYARSGKGERGFQKQIDALLSADCSMANIYKDSASGDSTPQPGLEACIASLEKGDTLITWRLDRISDSLSHIVTLVEKLCQKGIHFSSICDTVIDTKTCAGEIIINVFLSLAHFDRLLISESNRPEPEGAKTRKRRRGREKTKPDHPKVIIAKELSTDMSLSVDTICHKLKVSRATYYRYLKVTDS